MEKSACNQRREKHSSRLEADFEERSANMKIRKKILDFEYEEVLDAGPVS